MPQSLPTEPVAVREAAVALRALACAAVDHRPATTARIAATPFAWVDPKTIPPRGALDLSALARDPVGTACRAEIRRVGKWLAAYGHEAMEAALIEASGGEEGAGRRDAIIRAAWVGIPAWDVTATAAA